MTISVNTLIADIKRHLSIIGKRAYTKDGKNLFSNVTLSTAEDRDILTQYINAAAENIEAACRQLVTSFVLGGGNVVIVMEGSRGNLDYDSRAQEMVTTYITLYSVGEYLAMAHPEYAQKYQADAVRAFGSLVSYAFYKEPPTATADPTSATAVVS